MMDNNVKWRCEEKSNITRSDIAKVEKIFQIKFPSEYIGIVLEHDGGYPKPNRFNVNGAEEIFNNLLSFNEDDYINIVDTYEDVEDRLIKRIIPIAEDPFGNLICFDYSKDDRPVVVFWEHEKAFNNKENALTFVCNTFSELMDMLYESEE